MYTNTDLLYWNRCCADTPEHIVSPDSKADFRLPSVQAAVWMHLHGHVHVNSSFRQHCRLKVGAEQQIVCVATQICKTGGQCQMLVLEVVARISMHC